MGTGGYRAGWGFDGNRTLGPFVYESSALPIKQTRNEVIYNYSTTQGNTDRRIMAVEGWGFDYPVGSSQRLKKLAPVASLVSIHHLRPRAGLVGPMTV